MFETAEVGNRTSKEQYSAEQPHLRAELLLAQRQLADAGFAVVVLLTGCEGAGKSEVLNLLLEWLDARGLQVHAVLEPTEEERERPPLWRFWMALPPAGRMALFHGSWHSGVVGRFARGAIGSARLDQSLDRLVAFERMLTQERVLLVKFWLHLPQAALRKRLQKLARDPLQSWRVTSQDRRFLKHYDANRQAAEHLIRRTDSGAAPWTIVEATDRRYRDLTVARTLLARLRERLEAERLAPAEAKRPDLPKPTAVNVINRLDQSLTIEKPEYDRQLLKYQGKISRLSNRLLQSRRSLLVLFEGPDAAGKGGAIRRLGHAIDARQYRVMAVGAPTDEERARPYLWRFWRHLPRRGQVTIYDRSWYGRVLVERVEGFCPPEAWMRAYSEINEFEQELTDFGVILVKFWLAITPEEQFRRFEERETTPYKQYKLTEEDWRNRAKWDAYEAAACDMVERTSTSTSPWVLVEANSKEWARLTVLKTVAERLRQGLKS